MFEFIGTVESSKSVVNRALIVQSYEPALELGYQSEAQDVLVLKKALGDFANGKTSFFCADAGTSFRFLVVRLSRCPGTWTVAGSERLLGRPQKGLLSLLEQLGVAVTVFSERWVLESQGWNSTEHLKITAEESSQFASAALLNMWNLPFDVKIVVSEDVVSRGYLQMTLQMVRELGMKVEEQGPFFKVSANQKIIHKKFVAEADVSSCFALVASAVQNGQVCIQNFPWDSMQPDIVFVEYLQKMGVSLNRQADSLRVLKTKDLKPIKVDLKGAPDLFPVLAVLCARANGVSHLTGLGHLPAKESNRLENTIQLLQRLGRKTELKDYELKIWGEASLFTAAGLFDPDKDHRMAMAAQVANFYGASFKINTPSVVEKSFPQFWQNVGLKI